VKQEVKDVERVAPMLTTRVACMFFRFNSTRGSHNLQADSSCTCSLERYVQLPEELADYEGSRRGASFGTYIQSFVVN